MKKVKSILFALVVLVAILQFNSCSSGGNDSGKNGAKNTAKETAKDDELKSFMAGGIYFANGYGGKAGMDNLLTQLGTGNEDILKAAREYFILPFKPEQASDIKQTLSSMWEVNSKDDLTKTLNELKAHSMKSSYTKSWDYARYVNNACMGYAAGYFTEAETKKLVAEVLPLVQKDYKTWNDYFADFSVGRNKWDSEESSDKKAFNELSKTITQGDHNLYSLLPLN